MKKIPENDPNRPLHDIITHITQSLEETKPTLALNHNLFALLSHWLENHRQQEGSCTSKARTTSPLIAQKILGRSAPAAFVEIALHPPLELTLLQVRRPAGLRYSEHRCSSPSHLVCTEESKACVCRTQSDTVPPSRASP